jgi:hypothetical protein
MIRILSRNEIIGSRISRITEVDLPYDVTNRYQPRRIVVHLESGARFALQQERAIIDPGSGRTAIYSDDGLDSGRIPFVSQYPEVVGHLITRIVLTYGWRDECALVLDNGLIVHTGYSDCDNGLMVTKMDSAMEKNLTEINV